ncbi:extracellular catalytic domain type 1 short-chain-length polyhydroxyalkanoate depolymerase [Deinococcus peraridilitoris]|uniref:Esterase, PHB depolymerase family n=1 Tax=Deinococcus peraridilitoris (strain DSM 19664 / LMG 22246 / CIP 109416 / KR-200) TaxID=937777 RepID=L0A0Y6_DEIPD|nr:PHB depolymerase family esterase [Deinococcus peraridilitoris]AFZ67511.1 esterase, PHB depolymerase family [Deinococcus peraridilitoris DSM 19664]
MRIQALSAVLALSTLLAACGQHSTDSPDTDARVNPLASGYWVSGTYSNAYGARYYRLWVPAGYDGSTARPLMVMLHGCKQDGYDFAAGTRMNALADSRNFLVLYPEQGTAYNAYDCWNWFYDANQHRGSGEPSIIAGMISWVKSNYRVDNARVGVAGLSAGAAMSNIMGCTYPDHIRKVASFAGLMYRAALSATGATDAMNYGNIYDPNSRGTECSSEMGTRRHVMPTLVFHGTSDGTVNIKNAHQTNAQWAQTNDLASDGTDNGNVDNTADASASATACRSYTRYDYQDSATGAVVLRKYLIDGLGHAWSGGSSGGSYSDPCGPDASSIIVNFFGF